MKNADGIPPQTAVIPPQTATNVATHRQQEAQTVAADRPIPEAAPDLTIAILMQADPDSMIAIPMETVPIVPTAGTTPSAVRTAAATARDPFAVLHTRTTLAALPASLIPIAITTAATGLPPARSAHPSARTARPRAPLHRPETAAAPMRAEVSPQTAVPRVQGVLPLSTPALLRTPFAVCLHAAVRSPDAIPLPQASGARADSFYKGSMPMCAVAAGTNCFLPCICRWSASIPSCC